MRWTRSASPSRRLLLLAGAASVLLYYVPYAEIIVYPFRVFVTFIHETSHALAAWASGGAVGAVQIYSTGDGVTLTRGGSTLVVSSAGYVGSVGYGALLLRLCRRPGLAKPALALTAGLIALTTLWLLRPIIGFGFFAGGALTVLLSGVAAFSSQTVALFFAAFLAIECCMNALFDLKTLLFLSAKTSIHTDALNMEQATGIPALFWALAWSAVSLVILMISIRGVVAEARP